MSSKWEKMFFSVSFFLTDYLKILIVFPVLQPDLLLKHLMLGWPFMIDQKRSENTAVDLTPRDSWTRELHQEV